MEDGEKFGFTTDLTDQADHEPSDIPLPYVQSPGHRISEFMVHSEDYSACVVWWPWAPHLGRCLVIQETDSGHVHIRLRDDVSNEEALRHAAKLLQAVAAPPRAE
jgi:hypothetical protein